MVAQALMTLGTPREEGGVGLSAEDADGAAQLYDALLQQLQNGEAALEGIEPTPSDLASAVTASLQNMLQIAILSRLSVVQGSKLFHHMGLIEAQAELIGRCVNQNEELIGLVRQLQEQVTSAVALVNHAAANTRPLTDDDTRH